MRHDVVTASDRKPAEGELMLNVMVLAAIRHPAWAVGCLLVFGVGTIAGMMLMTQLQSAHSVDVV